MSVEDKRMHTCRRSSIKLRPSNLEDLRVEGVVLDLPLGYLVEGQDQISGDRLTHHRVTLVVLMSLHEPPDPLRQGHDLPRHLHLQELRQGVDDLEGRVQTFLLARTQQGVLEELLEDGEQSQELIRGRPEEDLIESELLDYCLLGALDVGPEEESLLRDGVPLVCPVEVLLDHRQGDVEVEVGDVVHHHDHDEDQDVVGGVLVRRQLDLHRPELHPPADAVVDRDLEPHRVPVRGIYHLEEVVGGRVHLFELLVHHHELSAQQDAQVPDEGLVHLEVLLFEGLADVLYCLLVDPDWDVVVLGLAQVRVGEVGAGAGVPGFRLVVLALGVHLLLCSVVHTVADDVPPDIPVAKLALQDGSACREGQEHGTDHVQVVIEISSVIDVLC